MANEIADRFRVLLSCPDRRGIVAEVSRLLAEQGANVTAAAQFTDAASISSSSVTRWRPILVP